MPWWSAACCVLPAHHALGGAGDLAALRQNVVAAGGLGLHAEGGHRPADNAQLPGDIVQCLWHHKGKVEVAQVVVHRAAARGAAHQRAASLAQGIHPAFLPGVLAAANDHGVGILPQEQGGHLRTRQQQRFLDGQVDRGVKARALIQPVHVSSSGWY